MDRPIRNDEGEPIVYETQTADDIETLKIEGDFAQVGSFEILVESGIYKVHFDPLRNGVVGQLQAEETDLIEVRLGEVHIVELVIHRPSLETDDDLFECLFTSDFCVLERVQA